jgi:hypothetical protein
VLPSWPGMFAIERERLLSMFPGAAIGSASRSPRTQAPVIRGNTRETSFCHRRLTPKYRQLVADAASTKQVHHLRSPAEMRIFIEAIKRAHRPH